VRYLHNGPRFRGRTSPLLFDVDCQIWIIAEHLEMFELHSVNCVNTLDIKKMQNLYRVGEKDKRNISQLWVRGECRQSFVVKTKSFFPFIDCSGPYLRGRYGFNPPPRNVGKFFPTVKNMQQCDIRTFTALCDVTYLLILSLLF